MPIFCMHASKFIQKLLYESQTTVILAQTICCDVLIMQVRRIWNTQTWGSMTFGMELSQKKLFGGFYLDFFFTKKK